MLLQEPVLLEVPGRCLTFFNLYFAPGPWPSHYLISFRLTYIDFRFGVGQVQGKRKTVTAKESNGGSKEGLGSTEGVIANRSDGSHLPSRLWKEAKESKEEMPCVLAWCL